MEPNLMFAIRQLANVFVKKVMEVLVAITARQDITTTPSASLAIAQLLEVSRPSAITPESVLVFRTLLGSDAISA